MKKIHFDYYRSTFNLILTAIVIIGGMIMVSGLFKDLTPKISFIGMLINSLGVLILFGKMFFFSPYVSWNKKGMVIKFNSFLPKSILFKDIKSYSIENKVLSIFYYYNTETYDLQQVRATDINKLNQILKEYIPVLN